MWQRQIEITPSDLGVSGVLLSATTNSNWIECRGASQLTLEVDITNATGAALPVVWYLDTQRFGESATTARRTLVGISAAPVGTVVTTSLYREQLSYTTPAAADTYRLRYSIPIDFQAFRLTGITAAGAGAGDLISVHARIGF